MNFELKLRKVTVFLKFRIILLLFPLGVFAQGNGLSDSYSEGYAVIKNWKTNSYWFVDKKGEQKKNWVR